MEITDGTAKWKVKTKTNKEYVDEGRCLALAVVLFNWRELWKITKR